MESANFLIGAVGVLCTLLFFTMGVRAVARRYTRYRGAEFHGRSAVVVGILYIIMGLCVALAGCNLVMGG